MRDVSSEIEVDQSKRDSRISARLLVVASIISWILVLWVLNASRYLRPVADDYCIGVRGAVGPIGGFIQDFQTYSGFATPSFLTNLFVGVPLATGGLWIASALTFIVASMAISLLGVSMLAVSSGFNAGLKAFVIRVLLVAPIVLVGWWIFLWLPLESWSESPMDELAIGLTHWQNLNSAYVLPTALILSAALLLMRNSLSRSWRTSVASVILGLVTGLMGPTFGMAALLFLLLASVWTVLNLPTVKTRYLLEIGGAFTGVAVGLAIAYLSPGTQARASYYGAGEVVFAPDSIVGWVMAVLPENLLLFGELFLHWGSPVVISLFAGVGFFASRKVPTMRTAVALPITIGLIVFGVSLTSATIITDTFAYGAYWHSSSIAVVAFAACASFGLWVGGLIPNYSHNSVVLVASFALLVGLASGIGSSLDLSTSIVEREQLWRSGSAPIKGIIEDREVEWIGDCADQLALINPAFS